MNTTFGGLLFVALLGLTAPAAAEHGDGLDNNGNGQIDEEEEQQHEACCLPPTAADGCLMHGRIEYCLPYHTVYCQQIGLPLACRLADLGNQCYGGDPEQCQDYLNLIQANAACGAGDQSACAWLQQQPILQQ